MGGGRVTEKNELVKDVAIYLRKSRGDLGTDLERHRFELTELCKSMGFNYKEFAEIGTSDSIEARPEFNKMLNEIEEGMYDAVVVMDVDRLGRGDEGDWAKIDKIFREHEILVITPDKVYDLENENDDFHMDIKKFFARIEFKTISKRLRRGKVSGAKKGKWTNGIPPFPYYYDSQNKNIEVDEEKLIVYRHIIDKALSGLSAEQIAWALNSMGYPSPRGRFWSSTAVYRIIYDQTHLGKIVINKSKGSCHKNRKTKPYKKIDKNNWTVCQGEHQAIKSQEEHERILELFAKRRIIPKAARRGAFLLSGLVYCGKCGYSMQFTRNGKSDIEYVKKCQKSDHLGSRCGNGGINTQILITALFDQLKELENKLKSKKYDQTENELFVLKEAIDVKKKQIEKDIKALDKIQEQRENGEINRERFLERTRLREDSISELKKEIKELEERISQREKASDERKLYSIEEFYTLWNSSESVEDKNRFMKRIVDKIFYEKKGKSIEIKIHFH